MGDSLVLPTVLLSGFEAFGGDAENVSWRAVSAVRPDNVRATLVRIELPCVFGASVDVLREAIRRHRPSVVLCVGQAAGRAMLGVERVAINVDDAQIPDNRGSQPIDRPVVANGPVGYWSTLPIKAIVAELLRQDVPAETSQSAGTFVCNHVFYALMRTLARRRGIRGGFVHVPLCDDMVTGRAGAPPSLPLEDIVRGIEIALNVTLETREDERRGGGALH